MVAERLRLLVPAFGWVRNYDRSWLGDDVTAGLTAAAVVIPQAMAYATLAGLPVEVGLYTALVPMLVYALLGTSRPLSVSTTSTISIITAATLAKVVDTSDTGEALIAATALALLTGLMLVAASILRLGFIANFISQPVLVGFKAGIGLVIFADQLGKVFGISVPKGRFSETVTGFFSMLGETHWLTLAVGAGSLALLLALPRLSPRLSAPLVVVVLGILASWLFDLGDRGVAQVGEIPSGLPSPAAPDLSLMGELWPAAVGIALMAFVESIAAARSFQRREDREVDANQELLALGLANVAGSFFRTYPAGGGTSQTAVNDGAGARTQLASITTVVMVGLTLLVFTGLIELMPIATLGALVLVVAAGLINVNEFRAIARVRLLELSWALVAFAGVLMLGTLEGIAVAVAVSLLSLIWRADRPAVYLLGRDPRTGAFRRLDDHPGDETIPGLVIVRTEGLQSFANAPRVEQQFWDLAAEYDATVVLFDCSAIPDFEYTAITRMVEVERRLREADTQYWLAGLNREPREVIGRSPLAETLGPERIFDNVRLAVDRYEQIPGAYGERDGSDDG